MNKKVDLIGPFETRKYMIMILFTNDNLYLLKLDFFSQLKYHLLPLWEKRLHNSTIDSLLKKYNYKKINYSENFQIFLRKSKFWKHQLEIEREKELIKLNILYRKKIDFYFVKFKAYIDEQRVSKV
jgi:hypothetical protein